MVQRPNDAAVQDAQIILSKEEFATGMGQQCQGRNVAVKGVQIISSKEECALGTGHRSRSNDAAARDALIRLRLEGRAFGMGQRWSHANDAALKDAQIKPSVEDYVKGTEHIAIHKTNLLHSDQSSIRLMQFKPIPIGLLPELPLEDIACLTR